MPPGLGPAASKLDARREERRAALLKRQVAGMEVSPTMLRPEDAARRDGLLRGGPDVAPPSSYEELPAAQHCLWADTLLLSDSQQLRAPSTMAPGVDHAGLMAAALAVYEAPPEGAVLLQGRLGSFAVDADTAALIAGT